MVKVSQVMGKVYVIDGETSLKHAAQIMSNKNITNLIIVKDRMINGLITDRDILKNLQNLDKPVRKIMSRHVVTIKADAELEDAGRIMTSKNIKRLPVVRNGKLVGAVNFTDVIGHCDLGEGEDGEFFFN